MNNLSLMSKQELLKHSKDLSEQDRKISLSLIECLREVEKRLLFSELGFSSLWEFAVKYLQLSEGSAQRRISAMRLTSKLPEIKASLENGSLSVTNAAQLQSHFRNEEKKGKQLSHDEKLAVVESMEGLSKKECERELLKLAPESIPPEKERPLTENLTELRFVINQTVMEKLEILKGLLGHQLPQPSLSELFEFLVTRELEKQEKKKAGSPKVKPESKQNEPTVATSSESVPRQDLRTQTETKDGDESAPTQVSPPPAIVIHRKTIPVKIRRNVWTRCGDQCEYIGDDGKRCSSRRKLEFDHYPIPVALGGSNEETNIRVVCKTHNLTSAVHIFGKSHMQQWLPSIR